MNRLFRRLVVVKLISDAGGFLDWVAMSLYIFSLRRRSSDVGLFLALKTAGGVLGGVCAGSLGGFDRKRLMAAADLVRGGAVALLLLAPERAPLWALCAVGGLLGFCGNVFTAALQASVPAIVGEKERPSANALLNSAGCAAMVAGSLSAGALMGRFGIRPIWAIDSVTYFLSALNLLLLPIRTSEAPLGAPSSSWACLTAVRREVWAAPSVAFLLLIRLADTLGSAGHNVAFPVFSNHLIPGNPSLAFGAIISFWAVGKIAGGRLAAGRDGRESLRRLDVLFGAATALMSASFSALFFLERFPAVLSAAWVAGAADGVSEVFFVGRLQRLPEAVRAGVFGAAGSIQSLGLALGMALCSPLFDLLPAAEVVVLLHSAPFLLSVLFAVGGLQGPSSPDTRDIDGGGLAEYTVGDGRQDLEPACR